MRARFRLTEIPAAAVPPGNIVNDHIRPIEQSAQANSKTTDPNPKPIGWECHIPPKEIDSS